MRSVNYFNKKFKMEKLAKVVFNYEEKKQWDKNLLDGNFEEVYEGVKSYG